MSQKGKKAAKGGRGTEEKRDDVLQAVVVADSFQDRFQPLSIDKPRCLLPLANTPLIEYTLEFLALNGVQEVFIYAGSHKDQVEDYINQSRWSPDSHKSPFTSLTFIRISDARSVGDYLRDLDKRGYIDGDFILVHGDLVSNLSLDKALAAHKARRQATATNIMTVVLREAGNGDHRTKTNAITPVYVTDTKTNRILHYDETHPLQSDHFMTLDPTVIDELSADFEVRTDLIDAQVDICTPEVLALWSESFDYELPRRNFLHGVLKDWELNGNSIYAEIVSDGYAARASNLQMYESISKDVIGRWTFPFIPECNVLPGQSYTRRSHGVSTEDGVELASSSKVSNTVVGQDTSIGHYSKISWSTIGKRCKIGKNVVIEDSFIWDDVVIEDGAVITRSLLANSTTIGQQAIVPEGSVLSKDVTISENVQLPEMPVLSAVDYDGNTMDTDTKLVGTTGKGANYVDPDADERDPEDPSTLQRSLIYSLAGLSLSSSSLSTLNSDLEDDSDDEFQGTGPSGDGRTRLSSFASDDSGSVSGKSSSFHHDAVHGLLDALRDETGDFEPAKLEFMGLRLSNDASDAQMRKAVAVAFARRAAELVVGRTNVPVDDDDDDDASGDEGQKLGTIAPMEPTKAADKTFARSGASKFVREVGVAGEEPEQVELVVALQKALVSVKTLENARAGTLLAAILQQLYNLDVLEEDGILAWWADERASKTEDLALVKEKCKVLVEWLENAEEEDDDSEEDDSE